MSKPTHTPTPGPWQKIASDLQMLILSRMERKSCAGTSYDVCEATDEEIIRVIEKHLDPKYAAAPDMLEVLELEESLSYHPRGSRIPAKLETLWGQRFCEEFERGEPSLINDLYSLAIRLRRRALAKAKGEADGS